MHVLEVLVVKTYSSKISYFLNVLNTLEPLSLTPMVFSIEPLNVLLID